MSHALDTIKRFYRLRPQGVVHIGANSGQEVAAYREREIAPVVFVEPLADPFARLVRAIGDTPRFFPVKACLSDTAGKTVSFKIASNGGQSSSYYEPGRHLEIYPHVTFGSEESFVTATLDDIVRSLSDKLDPLDLDYIGLDTQGSEMDIIRGGSETVRRAKFVFSEVSFKGLYKEAPDVYEMIDYMRSQGFDLYNVLMRDKSWGDALFVRQGVIV